MTDVVDDLKKHPNDIAPVALKWTALQPGYTFAGFFQLDFARNWSEFDAAVSNISISQNFVYADTAGNIGYRMSGLLPIRPVENGRCQWLAQLPRMSGRATCRRRRCRASTIPEPHDRDGQQPDRGTDNFGQYVTTDWDYGYRARRITDLLSAAPPSRQRTISASRPTCYSIPASKLTPKFITAGRRRRATRRPPRRFSPAGTTR